MYTCHRCRKIQKRNPTVKLVYSSNTYLYKPFCRKCRNKVMYYAIVDGSIPNLGHCTGVETEWNTSGVNHLRIRATFEYQTYVDNSYNMSSYSRGAIYQPLQRVTVIERAVLRPVYPIRRSQ